MITWQKLVKYVVEELSDEVITDERLLAIES